MHTKISDIPIEMQVGGIETRGMATGGITVMLLDILSLVTMPTRSLRRLRSIVVVSVLISQ